jgi:cobalt-zinc-cadmium efflux system protein
MNHSSHNAEASSSPGGSKLGRRLLIALALNIGITVAEVVGGVVSGSLALLADAAHNFSDAASVLVSYIAWRIAQRPANRKRTFGYGRAETVGALINLTTLLVIGLYLLYEAASRLNSPQDVAGPTMLIVGVIALVEDIAAAWVLRKDLGSLNVKSTYLHMIADALATVGVIIAGAAVMIWGQGISWIDPAVTAVIAIYIFWHGGREIRETIAVLIDSAPDGFDFDGMVTMLKAAPGVVDVHHIHIWRREENTVAIEAHLALKKTALGDATAMKEQLKQDLRDKFDIAHATLEIELADGVYHSGDVVATEQDEANGSDKP